VTSFWFTPTQPGRFEVLCAQLCGLGHAAMRGYVVVEDDAAFQAWLQRKPTFAAARAPTTPVTGGAETRVQRGQALSLSLGCAACHSVDGSPGAGPSWKGLYGRSESLSDGSRVIADAAYLERAIREPQAQVVHGFAPIMPKVPVSDEQLAELMAYIKSLGDQPR
jgi:cytochrome c oxidase subunit 2